MARAILLAVCVLLLVPATASSHNDSIASKQAGAKVVILPKKNEKDLRDVPEEIRKSIKLVLAETMAQVLDAALRRRPRSRHARTGSANPLTPSGPASRQSRRSASARRTPSEIRISSTAAASVRREARFTDSPVTAYSE